MSETKSVNVPNGASNGQAAGKPPRRIPKESFPDPPLLKAILTHLSYGIMTILGHIIDVLRKLGLRSDPDTKSMKNKVGLGSESVRGSLVRDSQVQ